MSNKYAVARLLKVADNFLKKSQMTTSITPDQVGPILDKAGMWGGAPFNTNGKVADAIFSAMDKAGFQGKFDAHLIIDPKYGVKIILNSSNPKTLQLQNILQNTFAAKMSQALKSSKVPAPDGDLTVNWLSDVANVA